MRFDFRLIAVLILVGCTGKDFTPGKWISKEKQDSLLYEVVHYAAKVPPTATVQTRFESRYDPYYQSVMKDYDIRSYYIDEAKTHYLLVTRQAKSIKPMRESIGIKMRFNNTQIQHYEEVFRTWKMSEELMSERYPILFKHMVEGKSLEPFYPKNKGDQYIEFPDGRFYFDTTSRRWRDGLMDSLSAEVENKY
jgi:hypothetical protein